MKTVKIQLKDIPFRKQSKTPFFTHCRRLIKQGVDPETKLEIWDGDMLRTYTPVNIGFSAKWTVEENKRIGPRLIPFKEPGVTSTSTPKDALFLENGTNLPERDKNASWSS